MIITTQTGEKIDTATLSPAERHILQKLFAWASLVKSVSGFQEKKQEALEAGWNQSGPVTETRALALVARHLEVGIRQRLKSGG
jgi:hypothetical protein